jgi:hypothetical protein
VARFAGGGEFVTGTPGQRDQASRRIPWTFCRACQNIRLLLSKVRLDHGQPRCPKGSAIVRYTRFRSGARRRRREARLDHGGSFYRREIALTAADGKITDAGSGHGRIPRAVGDAAPLAGKSFVYIRSRRPDTSNLCLK